VELGQGREPLMRHRQRLGGRGREVMMMMTTKKMMKMIMMMKMMMMLLRT
jgi:hypothetical protein